MLVQMFSLQDDQEHYSAIQVFFHVEATGATAHSYCFSTRSSVFAFHLVFCWFFIVFLMSELNVIKVLILCNWNCD